MTINETISELLREPKKNLIDSFVIFCLFRLKLFPIAVRLSTEILSLYGRFPSRSGFLEFVVSSCTCLTGRQSPDLITASSNGLRAISLWAAAWATTTLLHMVVRKVTGQTAFDFVVSSSSFFVVLLSRLSLSAASAISFHCLRP